MRLFLRLWAAVTALRISEYTLTAEKSEQARGGLTEQWGDNMTVEIMNGSSQYVDITPYIAWQGLTFSKQDVDGPDAGRTMDGRMHRDRVAIKEKMQIKTVPLSQDKIAILQTLLDPETLTVRVNPYPKTNASKVMTMYTNNVSTQHIIHRSNGDDIESMSFPLIEV